MIDFPAIAKTLLMQAGTLVPQWLPAGKRVGHEYVLGNLKNEPGESLSISLLTGKWADFSTDEKGSDLLSLYAAIHKIKQSEAAKELGFITEKEFILKHPSRGLPTKKWAYYNREAKIIGYVCRFDKPEGGKDVIPYTIQEDGKWSWKAFPKPRPLYNLDQLEKLPEAPVLILEGEKCTDAASTVFTKNICVTWSGGCKAFNKTDWSPLKGRNVTIWPDADPGGIDAANGIAAILTGLGCKIRMVDVSCQPKGWDVADAIAEGIDVKAWAKQRVKDWEPPPTPLDDTPPPEFIYEPEEPLPAEEEFKNNFFRFLGYGGNMFYFYSLQSEQLITCQGGDLTSSAGVLKLAPIEFWTRMGMVTDRGSLQLQNIANMLIGKSYAAGIFDPTRCRGRGAWEDSGRAVLHLGDKLIVDGETMPIRQLKTRYVYNKGVSSEIDYAEALPTSEAHRLVDICRAVRWEDKINGDLLAGWLMIAPICGSLTHRPHIYIIGPAKSGKSWVMSEIVARILGKVAFITSSKSTEAGIRQGMGTDALPIVFDEAEAEKPQDKERLQNVFDLSRVSFGGDSAPIHKGTANQEGMFFIPRSCFAFASINMSMTRYADETRTTILKIKPASTNNSEDAKNFENLERMVAETITPEWRGGLLARAMRLIGVIKKNHKVFAKVAGVYFGSRRQGDQLGAILAGLYALHSNGVVTEEQAQEFIERHQWEQQKEVTSDSSHSRMLQYLLQSEIKVDTDKGVKTRLISELVEVANGGTQDYVMNKYSASVELGRKGFKVRDGNLLVSNTHVWIAERLKASEWTNKWMHTLLNIPGAKPSEKPERFGQTTTRAVVIPLSVCIEPEAKQHFDFDEIAE